MRLYSTTAYNDVTVNELAGEAGVAYGLVAYYFKDKRGLWLEAVRRALVELLEAQAPGDEPTVEERILGMIRRFFTWSLRHPQMFLRLARPDPSDPAIYEIHELARGIAVEQLSDQLGIKADQPPLLRAALRGWTGAMDELAADIIAHPDIDLDDLARLALDTLTAMLSAFAGVHTDLTSVLARLKHRRS